MACLALLLLLGSPLAGAGVQEVEVVVHGAVTGGGTPRSGQVRPSPGKCCRLEAGEKVIVECQGQWRQEVERRAFFTGDPPGQGDD